MISLIRGFLFLKKQKEYFSEFFWLELGFCTNHFNRTEIFVSRLFKIVTNQTEDSRLEQGSVIHLLLAEKGKQCEIY